MEELLFAQVHVPPAWLPGGAGAAWPQRVAGMGSTADVCCRGASTGGLHLSDAQRSWRVSPINAN